MESPKVLITGATGYMYPSPPYPISTTNTNNSSAAAAS